MPTPGAVWRLTCAGRAAGLREAVGHPDRDDLLQAEDVAEVVGEPRQHRQLGRAGVAEHRGHALLAEHREGRVTDRRHARGLITPRAAQHACESTAVAASTAAMIASDSQIGGCQTSMSSIFTPMKAEDHRQPLGEVDEAVHHPDEHEVQRAQAEHRERVRGEDDERLLRDGEDRRDGVDREDQVGRRDDDEHGEQRRGDPAPVLLVEQLVAVVAGGHRHALAQEPQRGVVLGLDVRVVVAGELVGGVEQQRAEGVEGDVEVRQQRGARDDEDQAQDERQRDAPGQHPRLHRERHREVAEDDREDEDVVERQRALEQVAGQVLRAGVGRPARPTSRSQNPSASAIQTTDQTADSRR